MPHIEKDMSKCNALPTWKVRDASHWQVTLEAIPWRGKLMRWLKGVSRPLNWSSDRPETWERFSAMNHYRNPHGGRVSSIGMEEFIDLSHLEKITDVVELRSMWEEERRRGSITEVSPQMHTYTWKLGQDSPPSAVVHFCYFWRPETVHEEEGMITVTFQPTLLAQLRHLFSLKGWSMNIQASAA